MKRIVTCLLAVCIMAMTSFTAFAEIPRVTEETKEFTFWAAYNPNYQTVGKTSRPGSILRKPQGFMSIGNFTPTAAKWRKS